MKTPTRFSLPFSLAVFSMSTSVILMSVPAVASDVATEGAEIGKWTMDYEAAKKLAETEELPMLLNFTGSDWCGWCKRMDAAVFAQDEWKEFATKEIVLVTLDFPQDSSIVPQKFVARNEKLKGEFEVQGYPTYVILDNDAKTQLGRLGAGADKTPASFIAELDRVLRFRPINVEKKVAELGEEKGAQYREALNALEDVKSDFEDWISTRPPRNPENEKKFEAFQKSLSDAYEELDKF